jgi:hypothetical protein
MLARSSASDRSQLDLRTAELRRNDAKVRLPDQSIKVLTLLVESFRPRALLGERDLLGDFVSIARMLNLPSSEAKEQEVTVAEVKQFLEAHTGWLSMTIQPE